MARITHVEVTARDLAPLVDLYGPEELGRVAERVRALGAHLRGHAIWNVNSTANGGGVAELLRSLVAYARGTGMDARWVVIDGDDDFFRTTKRIHNALHGAPGDDSPLDDAHRQHYERVSLDNAGELLAVIQPGDVVLLHDPQTAGLCEPLRRHGAYVIWRCHIGRDEETPETAAAWDFLAPFARVAHVRVFTRAAYVPPQLDDLPFEVVPPTIDPASPKNQPMSDDTARAILVHAGLVEGPAPDGVLPEFRQDDGSPSSVRRAADVLRLGRAPSWCCPMVVQISRWDRLKDPIGVIRGFARAVESGVDAALVLAGPNVKAVADDPEGAEVFDEVVQEFRALPHGVRRRVQLASLPMADAQENAAIVNALQRHAAVVVQKSLEEGFGLTVAEAMWKRRPVIATRVGGIQEQIEHGISGLLLDDPRDDAEFADALVSVLRDPELASRLGAAAEARVRERFISLRSLYAYADLIVAIMDAETSYEAVLGA